MPYLSASPPPPRIAGDDWGTIALANRLRSPFILGKGDSFHGSGGAGSQAGARSSVIRKPGRDFDDGRREKRGGEGNPMIAIDANQRESKIQSASFSNVIIRVKCKVSANFAGYIIKLLGLHAHFAGKSWTRGIPGIKNRHRIHKPPKYVTAAAL